MNKTIIIINGSGGVGKDTLCDIAATKFRVMNISSIDVIKHIASAYGGWRGSKTAKDRKFLSDLKGLFIAYNELPLSYVLKKVEDFINNESELMFIHIREPDEIMKCIKNINTFFNVECITLLVSRPNTQCWNNTSDCNVDSINYDFYFHNNKPLEELPEYFIDFLSTRILGK